MLVVSCLHSSGLKRCSCWPAATASLAIHKLETDEIVDTALSDSLVLTGEEEFVRVEK